MKKNLRKISSVILVFAMLLSLQGFQTGQAAKRPKLSASRVKLTVGKTYQLKIKRVSKSQIRKKRFTSSRKKVASVKSSGKIVAKKAGKTVVRCKLTLKNGRKYHLRCVVTVKNKQVETTQEVQVTTAPLVPVTSVVPKVSAVPGETGNVALTETKAPGTEVTLLPTESIDTVSSSSEPTQTGETSPAPGETKKPTATETNAPSSTETMAPGQTMAPDKENQTTETLAPGQTKAPDKENQTTETLAPGQTKAPDKENQSTETMAPGQTLAPGQENQTPETAAPTPTPSAGQDENTASPETTVAPGDSTDTTQEITDAATLVRKMGLGINLGNTFDSCVSGSYPSATSYETAWGAPQTTKAIIHGMKTAGFQTVRIPVAWSNMMSTDGKYTINEKYIERVKTVVSWVLDEDMYAIVNIHWDNGWWSWFGSSDETVQANAQTKYESMWTQLASAFQQYSDHLIFESANEELGDKFNDEIDGVAGILTTAECYQKVNELNQKFVDIVRTSGGNNAMRFLLIAGYNTDIVKTCSSSFVMPTDTIENHLIVSVHYYTPWQYCTEENPNNVWGYENSWGTDDDKTEMKTYLAKMKTNFVDKGYPVIIGEYGVCATKYSEDNRVQKNGRADFFQTLCEYALENGMCPVLWDTTDSVNQVYNRYTYTITDETEAALYKELAQKVAEYTSTGDNQETGSETTDTSTKAETATWEGTLEMSNWSLSSVTTGSVSGMKLQQRYGFLEISGVNWNSYSNPTLVIEPQSGAWEGNLGYSLALTMTEKSEWWCDISDTDIVKDIGNITSADPVEVSLSDVEGLTGTASLYLSLGLEKGAYSGTLKVQIVDK